MAKSKSGRELMQSSQRQPRDSIMKNASSDSKAAPIAQNDSINTTHLARCTEGKNSAYSVTLQRLLMNV
jgi:hypothetical protein